MRTNEIKNEIDEIRKWKEKITQNDLKYKPNKYLYDFQQFEIIRSFGYSICIGKIIIDEAEIDQSNLLANLVKFNKKSEPKTKEGKDKKGYIFDCVNVLFEGREITLNAFRKGIFPIKATQRKGCPSDLATRLKILIPKQMLQRFPVPLAQVTADDTSVNVLNEIRQIIYSLYREKVTTKNVYNNK